MPGSDSVDPDGDETRKASEAGATEDASTPEDEERLPTVARWTSLQARQMRSIFEGLTPKLDFAPFMPKVDFSILDYTKPLLEQHARTAEIFNRSLQGVVRPPTLDLGVLANLPAFKQFEHSLGLQAMAQLQQSLTADVLKAVRPSLNQIFQAARAVQPLLDAMEAEAEREKPQITANQVMMLLSVLAVIIAALTYWNDAQGRVQQGRADAAQLQQMQEMTRQQVEANEQLSETRRVIVDLVDRVARVRAEEPAKTPPPTHDPGDASTASNDDATPSP